MFTWMKRLVAGGAMALAIGTTGVMTTSVAYAADEPIAAAAGTVAAAAPAVAATVEKADIAWMMLSTILVILMVIPGLALFYGGLVRSKNMLSVLMQVTTVFSLIVLLWVIYGYS
ncbi:MAG: ammonia channel protein, partial [Polynucleobacter sp.]|nr:ammonia channel protein [Polynucleobacter sp.]